MEFPVFVPGNLVTIDDHREWAIGRIEELDDVQATVRFFTGIGTTRTCPLNQLVRFRYQVGDLIRSRSQGQYGQVTGRREAEGLVTYKTHFGMRTLHISETDVEPVPIQQDPLELLIAGDVHDTAAFVLAHQARRLHYAYQYDEMVSLSNSRIELLPHQVFVAHRVLSAYPHRFLLSDEVGLGKTIEAGLIMRELSARQSADRVLVIAPAGLVPQWVEEMKLKFNFEDFVALDSVTMQTYIYMHGSIEQIWERQKRVVTSLQLIRGHETHIAAIEQHEWDLIIFDEAHHLRRSLERGHSEKRRYTQAYRLAERLQACTTSLLLLTATPLQLHDHELYSLVELLDPTLFPTYADFVESSKRIQPLNRMVRQLDDKTFGTLTDRQQHALAAQICEIWNTLRPVSPLHRDTVLRELERSASDRARYREDLSSFHRLSSIMLRNRKREVFDHLRNRLVYPITVLPTNEEDAAYRAVTTYLQTIYNRAIASDNKVLGFLMVTFHKILASSSYALRVSFERRIKRLSELMRASALDREKAIGHVLEDTEERELDDLIERYGDLILAVDLEGIAEELASLKTLRDQLAAIETDTKAQTLIQTLAQLEPGTKVIIFTQFKQTLYYLAEKLIPQYCVTTFYGGMQANEKERVIDAFRDPQGAQILIATEAAGEGRNLQFCHVMVNYDLPWNPMKIEQRIGRIDRIGQEHDVHIYNMTIQGTIEDRILDVLRTRIENFEMMVGKLDPILETDIIEATMGVLSPEAFEQRVTVRQEELQRMEEHLNADLILDARSFRRDRADEILGRKSAFTTRDIHQLMERLLKHLGGKLVSREAGIYDVTVPRRLHGERSRDVKDYYRATFDPEIARRHENLDFIAFGHPFMEHAIAYCMDDEREAKAAHILLQTNDIAPGYAICAVYIFTFQGIREYQHLRPIAIALDGTYLPDVSDQFLAQLLYAKDIDLNEETRHRFVAALEAQRETLESLCDEQHEQARQRHAEQNQIAYQPAYTKQERYYMVMLEAAQREVQRLEALLIAQQTSDDPNVRRVASATQGRLDASRRRIMEIQHERDTTLAAWGKKRTVSGAAELIGAAYVVIQPASE